MFCWAGIGGRVSGIMAVTATATQILALDGCPLNCVKNCLQQAGFSAFQHLQLADLGMEKGNTPPTPDHLEQVVRAGAAALSS